MCAGSPNFALRMINARLVASINPWICSKVSGCLTLRRSNMPKIPREDIPCVGGAKLNSLPLEVWIDKGFRISAFWFCISWSVMGLPWLLRKTHAFSNIAFVKKFVPYNPIASSVLPRGWLNHLLTLLWHATIRKKNIRKTVHIFQSA